MIALEKCPFSDAAENKKYNLASGTGIEPVPLAL
jgi:hypothetical protein